MPLESAVQKIVQTVRSWPGVTVVPHRFGGQEFQLGTWEIGHIHRQGLVDIPFPSAVRDILVRDGLAEAHHLLDESGWISFYVRRPQDVPHALWLYRLAYLTTTLTLRRQRPNHPAAQAVSVAPLLAELALTGDLQAAVHHMRDRAAS